MCSLNCSIGVANKPSRKSERAFTDASTDQFSYRDEEVWRVERSIISNLTIPSEGRTQKLFVVNNLVQRVAVKRQAVWKACCVFSKAGELAHRDGQVVAAILLRICRARL